VIAARGRWAVGAAALALAACIPSNVVATDQRLVAVPIAELEFMPAPGAALAGLYASVDIRGDAALSLRRIWYVFEPNGRYTAAALADVGGAPTFQTLDGVFRTTAEGLVLDDAAPVAIAVAGEHVRLSSPGGEVILRREGAW
jgi:hypothetical protein